MTHLLHSGHIHLAARQLPHMRDDCTPIDIDFDASYYQQLEQQLQGKLTLPALPESIALITQEMQQAHPNIQTIVHIIQEDPMLSGKLLHTLRQPAFQQNLKRPIEITSIAQCVNLIGLECTYQMAIASAMTQLTSSNQLIKHLINYAGKTAYACAEISGYLPPQQHPLTQQKAYLFGLYIHGGYLALANQAMSATAKLFEQGLSLPETAYRLEQQQQRITHEPLSVLVAMQWGIQPQQLTDRHFLAAIAHHHHPRYGCIRPAEIRLLIATGLLAQTMVSEIAYRAYQSEELLAQAQTASRVIGLSDEALSNIRKNLSSHWLTAEPSA